MEIPEGLKRLKYQPEASVIDMFEWRTALNFLEEMAYILEFYSQSPSHNKWHESSENNRAFDILKKFQEWK